jgi:hypothetical protein
MQERQPKGISEILMALSHGEEVVMENGCRDGWYKIKQVVLPTPKWMLQDVEGVNHELNLARVRIRKADRCPECGLKE